MALITTGQLPSYTPGRRQAQLSVNILPKNAITKNALTTVLSSRGTKNTREKRKKPAMLAVYLAMNYTCQALRSSSWLSYEYAAKLFNASENTIYESTQ